MSAFAQRFTPQPCSLARGVGVVLSKSTAQRLHSDASKLSRRRFLQNSSAAAGTLVIATTIDFFPGVSFAATANDGPLPNAFVKIAADNTVTVIIKHLDKGQGVATGLTTIVADELDADWAQMRCVFAPADAKLYNNLFMGPFQATGGSTSIANSWEQLQSRSRGARYVGRRCLEHLERTRGRARS